MEKRIYIHPDSLDICQSWENGLDRRILYIDPLDIPSSVEVSYTENCPTLINFVYKSDNSFYERVIEKLTFIVGKKTNRIYNIKSNIPLEQTSVLVALGQLAKEKNISEWHSRIITNIISRYWHILQVPPPIASVTTQVIHILAPQNLIATNLTSKTITLAWDSVVGATEYILESKNTTNQSWMPIYVGASTIYTHVGLISKNLYSYRVSARNLFGTSVPSSEYTPIKRKHLSIFRILSILGLIGLLCIAIYSCHTEPNTPTLTNQQTNAGN